MKNKPLASIFLIVFIDMLGFGLILPLLPYYAETFGASDTVIGLLVASYAAAQLVGAPILGRLSDRFGRRPILLLSLVGTLLGFLFSALPKLCSSYSLPAFSTELLAAISVWRRPISPM
jgi:MFS transporter, DHA1 family, tetracycline resistance protein